MPIIFGSDEITDAKVGNTQIEKVFMGADQVWPAGGANEWWSAGGTVDAANCVLHQTDVAPYTLPPGVLVSASNDCSIFGLVRVAGEIYPSGKYVWDGYGDNVKSCGLYHFGAESQSGPHVTKASISWFNTVSPVGSNGVICASISSKIGIGTTAKLHHFYSASERERFDAGVAFGVGYSASNSYFAVGMKYDGSAASPLPINFFAVYDVALTPAQILDIIAACGGLD